jgi:hypothetical protein
MTSRAAIVALLVCLAAATPAGATGSTTGGARAPGPDLAPGGVAAPDPAPAKSPAPKRNAANRVPRSTTTPANHTAPTPLQPRVAVATAAVTRHAAIVPHSSRPATKRARRPRRHQHAEIRPSRADPPGWVVPLPSRRLVAHATGSRGSQELLRAAVALFLVALAEGSLLLRLSAQVPRRA